MVGIPARGRETGTSPRYCWCTSGGVTLYYRFPSTATVLHCDRCLCESGKRSVNVRDEAGRGGMISQ